MKKKFFALLVIAAAAIMLATGCTKKPSFTSSEGENYIRNAFSSQGTDIMDVENRGIGSCTQTAEIISIKERTSAIDSHIDARWYEVSYKPKHQSIKYGQSYCTCESEIRNTQVKIKKEGKKLNMTIASDMFQKRW